MKTLKVLISLTLLFVGIIFGQEKTSEIKLSLSGFVKTDLMFDSRQTVNAREGHFLLFPAPENFDVNGKDIKKFPKLKGFVKRFIQYQPQPERVSMNNEIYERTALYSLILFPEDIGIVNIDPITVRLQYISVDSSNDPFGGMGFGLSPRSIKVKTVSSPKVEVEVLALPTQNVPPSFTGLVGKHDFKLSINKTKFLVNEAIEAKLTD